LDQVGQAVRAELQLIAVGETDVVEVDPHLVFGTSGKMVLLHFSEFIGRKLKRHHFRKPL